MTRITIYILFSFIIFISAPVDAQMMGPGGGHMMGEEMYGQGMHSQDMRSHMKGHRWMGKGDRTGRCASYFTIVEKLDLSENQRDRLRSIKTDFRKDYILMKAKMKVATIEMEDLLSMDAVDMSKVESKIKEITKIKGKVLLNAAKVSVKARAVLTNEQREKARELIDERKEACGMRGGHGTMYYRGYDQ